MNTRTILSLAAGLILAGCCETNVSIVGGRTLCEVDNSCMLICNGLPLMSGDPRRPNENESIVFKNTTTLANNLNLLHREMRRHNATALRDVTSFRTEEQVFFFLLKRTTLHTSAELVKNPVK